jgi:hypothetical protein
MPATKTMHAIFDTVMKSDRLELAQCRAPENRRKGHMKALASNARGMAKKRDPVCLSRF